MKIRVLPFPFYMGLTVLFTSTVLSSYGIKGLSFMFFGGSMQESLFTILLLTEIFYSKKASNFTKACWGLLYSSFPLIAFLYLRGVPLLLFIFSAGVTYFLLGRKKFIPSKNKVKHYQYDTVEY